MTHQEGIVLDCTFRQAQRYHRERQKRDARVSAYRVNYENLPADPVEVYERLLNTEIDLFPNWDYKTGSAKVDDDLLAIHGLSGAILTAEHASDHRRRKDGTRYTKEAEQGTGALGVVIAQETGSEALVAIGRQSGDANYDAIHPFKESLGRIINQLHSRAHLSLHGMVRALAYRPRDERGRSVQLGIGDQPSEATRVFAHDYMKEIGKDLDLIVGINDPHLRFKNGRPVLSSDGKSILTRAFKGNGNTTRAYTQSEAQRLGRDDSFVAVQVELSSVLRIPSIEIDVFPSQRDRESGAYLGYIFLRTAVESVSKLNTSS